MKYQEESKPIRHAKFLYRPSLVFVFRAAHTCSGLTLEVQSWRLLLILLVMSIRYNLRFGRIIIEIEDAIEESLDVLDTQYNSISTKRMDVC